MNSESTTEWFESLRAAGYRPDEVLGNGVEGTVIGLGPEHVIKIWYRRTASELDALKTFYAAVAQAGAHVRTPVIHRIIDVDGLGATVESRLDGTPVAPASTGDRPELDDAAVAVILDVLAALVAVAPTPAMAALPVLDSEGPFDFAMPFTHSLTDLVERRTHRFRAPLSVHIPDLDAVAAAVCDSLHALDVPKTALVHGDLIPDNVLSGSEASLPAVLDFGFMSTVGDPAFDAAITASIYDMYGPHSAAHEAFLDEAITARFDYDSTRLAVYRAAYALSTSNCFSASGRDGHFEWCIRMLERSDIRDALAL